MRFTTFLLKNLLRRKMRSLLTCFGIAVAIGTTVALLGISDGFERETLISFEVRGVDIVVIEKGKLNEMSSELDQTWVDRVRKIPGVTDAAPGLLDAKSFDHKGTTVGVLFQGWEAGSFLFDNLKPVDGRIKLKEGDGKIAILGKIMAENFGKKVGDTLMVDEEPFEVVGIYDSFTVFENGGVVVPLDVFQELQHQPGKVTGFSVKLDRSPETKHTIKQVIKAINDLTDEDGKHVLTARDLKNYVNEAVHIKMAHAMAMLTSVIAIVVGAIGMLNTMIMSVVERVREISILRAIGWQKRRVVGMIIGESLLLCFVGAILGAVGAVGLTRLLTQMPAVSGFISGEIAPKVIGWGFLMALAVALIGGSYPAYRATKLLPSEGLRHE